LGSIGPEQVPVVIVVEDHDRDDALPAHRVLDSGDPIEPYPH
jgi:hypothetical protein